MLPIYELTLTARAFKAMVAEIRYDALIPSRSASTRASTIPIFANLRAYP